MHIEKLRPREGHGMAQGQRDQVENSTLPPAVLGTYRCSDALASSQCRSLSLAGLFRASLYFEVTEGKGVIGFSIL